jgi:hypothetical protein
MRHGNDGDEENFFKRPPAKSTLMDFMTSVKITNDTKPMANGDNQNFRNVSETKRRQNERNDSTAQVDLSSTTMNSLAKTSTNNCPSDPLDTNTCTQTGSNEQVDPDDDPSHTTCRERRNPLPPRSVFDCTRIK